MESFHAARVALTDGQEERTSDLSTRVLGGHGIVAATGSAYDAIQGYASTVKARNFCKPKDLSDRAAGISARAWRTNTKFS